ncbi:MAG TPA: hypothetical protein VND94_17070 [Terriglobia bacterium]|nr:hypothetical protein [Terriglobia bacterium]
MAETKAVVSTSSAAGNTAGLFSVNAAWMKQLTEGPASFYSGIFDLAAKQLRVQADFIQDLGNCNNAVDLLRHQGKFIQSYWNSFAEEAWKTYGRGAGLDSSTIGRPNEERLRLAR